jgi:Protein of unknown function (DUF3800)
MISVADLYSLLGAGKSDYMATWKVFIDDSADQHKTEYVVAGVFIGRIPQWAKFQRKWNQALRNPPRIKHFHGKELRRLDGQFRQFRDPQLWPDKTGRVAANAKKNSLHDVINNSDLVGFGIGVYIEDYERVRQTHPRGKVFMPKDAFEYVLQSAIYETTKLIVQESDGAARVAFVSDLSNKAPRYTKVFADWKMKNPKTARYMLGISHENDEAWPGLQAADMAATTVKDVFAAALDKHRVFLEKDFPLHKRFKKIGKIDEAYHLEMLRVQSIRESEVRSDDGKRSI